MPITPRVQIDTSGLTQGIAAVKKVSKRSLPEIVNTSAYWIAVNAKQGTPYVTTATIDSQLALIRTPVIGKRGKPLKRKQLKGGFAPGQRGKAPLAALIIVARAKPGSRFNQLTSNRWALAQNPFRGRSRAEGRAAMAALVNKMGKGRHSSIKFLVAGWIPAIRKIAPYAVQKYVRGGGRAPLADAGSFHGANLGNASPAAMVGSIAVAMIENTVGEEGANAPAHARAVALYVLGPLQSAVDREGASQLNYATSKMVLDVEATVKPFWD